jgi:UDP-glucose 4-epimerase
MADGENRGTGLRVAVIGATGDLGSLLLPQLLADPGVASVLSLDISQPAEHPKVEHRRLDLTHHDAERELTNALSEARVDALYHLAFLFGPRRNVGFAHEVEVAGTMRVLSAAAAVGLPRLVLPSLTVVYGAHGQHAALLNEDAPLHGCPSSRFVTDKVEVERQVETFRTRYPQTKVFLLRFAPILGPSVNNPATRLLRRAVVPTLLGFDPLWQAVHEEDAGRAMHLALRAKTGGTFNIVGKGALPFSGMVRQAGGAPMPLPSPMARGLLRGLATTGVKIVPLGLLDYLNYSWIADGSRAEEALGFVPRFHTSEAAAALRRS